MTSPMMVPPEILHEQVTGNIPIVRKRVNSLILDHFKLTDIADDKIIMTQNLNFIVERVSLGKTFGYQHFLFSHYNVFKRVLCLGRLKWGLCGKELNGFRITLITFGFVFCRYRQIRKR